MAAAYRSWAVAQPHRYRLLFAAPLPGYDAHDPRLVEAAQQAMNLLLRTLGGKPPPDPEPAREPAAWSDADPGVAWGAITLWTRVHGFVSLEIEGNFASMGVDADRLFDAEVAALQ
jgi:hypothetical protein